MWLIIFCIVWWLCGFFSHMYWWSKDYDYLVKDALFGVFIGLIGPVAFLMGYGIHGDDEVLFKRRGK